MFCVFQHRKSCFKSSNLIWKKKETMEIVHTFHIFFHITASEVLPALLTILIITHVSCH